MFLNEGGAGDESRFFANSSISSNKKLSSSSFTGSIKDRERLKLKNKIKSEARPWLQAPQTSKSQSVSLSKTPIQGVQRQVDPQQGRWSNKKVTGSIKDRDLPEI